MSEDQNEPKVSHLKVLEFDKNGAKQRNEANKAVADMFQVLSQRALDGDIEDFVITFKSQTRGVESMIGGTIRGFDFIGYLGMLEVLKRRLLGIMDQMTYAYAFEPPKPKPEEKPDEPTKPDQDPI